jgi:hypothetical protein
MGTLSTEDIAERAKRFAIVVDAGVGTFPLVAEAPDRGIRGNSHMIMQDKNNLQIADLVLQWIGERVSRPREP